MTAVHINLTRRPYPHEFSSLGARTGRRYAYRNRCNHSRIHISFCDRRRPVPGYYGALCIPHTGPVPDQLREDPQPVFRTRYARSGNADWRRHMVHDRPRQPVGNERAHQDVRLGMGNRMGLLFRRDRRGDFLLHDMGEGEPQNASCLRLDIFRRRIHVARSDQWYPVIHADAGPMDRDTEFLARFLQSDLSSVAAHAGGDLRHARGSVCVSHRSFHRKTLDPRAPDAVCGHMGAYRNSPCGSRHVVVLFQHARRQR